MSWYTLLKPMILSARPLVATRLARRLREWLSAPLPRAQLPSRLAMTASVTLSGSQWLAPLNATARPVCAMSGSRTLTALPVK